MFFIYIVFLILVVLIPGIKRRKRRKEYEKTSYFKITHTPYKRLRRDAGKYGEYLTYKNIKDYEESGGKFLFNLYLPKRESETTELDIVLISSAGVFVFESKNYSGWIFGNDRQKMWTQTLPSGRHGDSHKEHFYNPVWQNRQHVMTLREYLKSDIPIYSVIVFADKCTFKDLSISDPSVRVILRADIKQTVGSLSLNSEGAISEEDIGRIYDQLYQLTQVSEAQKQLHVQQILARNDQTSDIILPDLSESADTSDAAKNPVRERLSDEPVVLSGEASGAAEPQNDDADQADTGSPAICPLCGGRLTIRMATRGARRGKQFYGCSNYPKCRYIKNI